MDRKTVTAIQQEIAAAISEIAERHNLVIQKNNAGYDANRLRLTLDFAVRKEDGTVMTHERRNLLTVGEYYGLGGAVDKVISYNGRKFQIVGMKARDGKYPVLAVDLANGKQYGLPLEGVKKALASVAA